MKSLYEIKLILQAGKLPEAFLELRSYLQQFPNDVDGWLLLAQSVDTKDRKLDCYQRILKIDPNNQVAQESIHKLVNSIHQELGKPEVAPSLKTQVVEPKHPSSPIPAISRIPDKSELSEKPIAQTAKHPSKSSSSRTITVIVIATAILCVLAIVFLLFLRGGPTQSLRAKAISMPNQEACNGLSFSDLAYDVRKSDSIVSPYIGTISGTYVDNSQGVQETINFTITLAYQDGKWVPKSADFTSPDFDFDTGTSVVQSFLEAAKNLLFACLE
jgi:hypothetical protein